MPITPSVVGLLAKKPKVRPTRDALKRMRDELTAQRLAEFERLLDAMERNPRPSPGYTQARAYLVLYFKQTANAIKP